MKVHELLAALQSCNPNAEVVMAKDREGNQYSPCEEVDANSLYVPQTTWYGDIYPATLSDTDRESGWSDDDLYGADDGQQAVVLWPVN